jgi:catechol 2,3-dioxygenase-like lactoylglutathione lyase family enzyme
MNPAEKLVPWMCLIAIVAAAVAHAQAPAPAGPAPTGLVVGSGNFFSPIVGDLDKAVAFYRDGLGLDVQGSPATADTNAALRNMFGLPDASLRWQIGRPGAGRGGVEMVEITKANGAPIARNMQDSGAFTLIAFVRDLDATLARLKQQGAPVVSRGGSPVVAPFGGQNAKMVVVADPAGHFVELVQPDKLPESEAPATANVVAVRVRLTVSDIEKAVRLYRDALGLQARGNADLAFRKDAAVLNAFGLPAGSEYRLAMLQVPATGLTFELIEFRGVGRRTVRGNIQDPGSTRIQLQVRDVEAAIAALKQAGGAVVSTGGTIVELPGRGGATTKVAIVRDPDNLFLVLLQAAPAQPPARP